MNFLKKIKNKSEASFGDTEWEYNFEDDKKEPSLQKFYTLPKSQKILEAGCGTGNYVVSLTKMGHNVIGIELDNKRVKIAKEYMKKYGINEENIIQGDLQDLPFSDNSFDAIFSHGVIEHIHNHEKAVNELYRVLKPGGYALITVPSRISSFTISKITLQIIDKIFNTHLWNIGYEKSFTKWKFKKTLQQFRIEDFRITEINPGHTIPLYGKILRLLDKPVYWIGIGGHWMYAWVRK